MIGVELKNKQKEDFALEIDRNGKTYKLLIPMEYMTDKGKFYYVFDHFHEFIKPSEDFVKVDIDFKKINLC